MTGVQPRTPAGSPEGGQFTFGAGRESTSALGFADGEPGSCSPELAALVQHYVESEPIPGAPGSDEFAEWAEGFVADASHLLASDDPHLEAFTNANRTSIAHQAEMSQVAFQVAARREFLYAALTERLGDDIRLCAECEQTMATRPELGLCSECMKLAFPPQWQPPTPRQEQ